MRKEEVRDAWKKKIESWQNSKKGENKSKSAEAAYYTH